MAYYSRVIGVFLAYFIPYDTYISKKGIVMYCSNCNTTYSNERLFCPSCGQRMSNTSCIPIPEKATHQSLVSDTPSAQSAVKPTSPSGKLYADKTSEQELQLNPPIIYDTSLRDYASMTPCLYRSFEQGITSNTPDDATSLKRPVESNASLCETPIMHHTSPFESTPSHAHNVSPATALQPVTSPTPPACASPSLVQSTTSLPAQTSTSLPSARFNPSLSSTVPVSSSPTITTHVSTPPENDTYITQAHHHTHALSLKQALDALYEPTSSAATSSLSADISTKSLQYNNDNDVSSTPPDFKTNTGNKLTRWIHVLLKNTPPGHTNAHTPNSTIHSSLRELQTIVVAIALCWPLGLYKLWRTKIPLTPQIKALTSACFLIQSTLALTILTVCSPYILEQQPFSFVRAYALDRLHDPQHTSSAHNAHDRSKTENTPSVNRTNNGKARSPDRTAAESNAKAILDANKGSASASAANNTSENNSANSISSINGNGYGLSQGSAHNSNGAPAQTTRHQSANTLRTNANDDTLQFNEQEILRLASFARVQQATIYAALTRAGFKYQPHLGSWCNALENCALTIRASDGHVIDAENLKEIHNFPCEKAYVYLECKVPFSSLAAFGACMIGDYEGVTSTYDNDTTHSYRIDTNTALSAFMTLTKKGDRYCGMLTWIKAPPL